MSAIVAKRIKANSAYFTIYWSHLRKVDKYEINSIVPSISGIYELYYMDFHKKLNLFYFAFAWYGGLRTKIRECTDPEIEKDPKRREVLELYDCYYRYASCSSYLDMCDIIFFFSRTYFPDSKVHKPSGRYKHIYVKELSQDKVTDI